MHADGEIIGRPGTAVCFFYACLEFGDEREKWGDEIGRGKKECSLAAFLVLFDV